MRKILIWTLRSIGIAALAFAVGYEIFALFSEFDNLAGFGWSRTILLFLFNPNYDLYLPPHLIPKETLALVACDITALLFCIAEFVRFAIILPCKKLYKKSRAAFAARRLAEEEALYQRFKERMDRENKP